MSLKKILIVEDSELLHRMYDLILMRYKTAGGVILHAMNGKEGLDILGANPGVDLVLLDVNMPIMTGIDFLQYRLANRIHLDVPVVIISTEGKEADTLRGIQLGARAYLTKPFKPNDLHAVIERVAGRTVAEPAPQQTAVHP